MGIAGRKTGPWRQVKFPKKTCDEWNEKMKRKRPPLPVIILCLVLVAVPAGAQPSAVEKASLLRNHLETLSSAGKTVREITGYSMITAGIVIAGASYNVMASDDILIPDSTKPYLFGGMLLGGVLMGFSLVPLSSETLPEARVSEFLSLADGSESELLEKISRGEAMLEEVAGRGLTGRMVTGLSCLAVTAGTGAGLVVGLANGSMDASQPGFYIIGGIGLLVLSSGLACLLSPSLAEKEARSYREWKNNGQVSSGPAADVSWSPVGLGIMMSF